MNTWEHGLVTRLSDPMEWFSGGGGRGDEERQGQADDICLFLFSPLRAGILIQACGAATS